MQDLIYKVEYKRDKANKRKVIIDALTSVTIIRKGGSKGGVCVVKKFIQVEEKLKANIWCMVSDYNQTVTVDFDGSVLKFKYTYYGCPFISSASFKGYPCPWEVSVIAEVLATSPLRLKVKEDWSRKFNGDYKETYNGKWEFIR